MQLKRSWYGESQLVIGEVHLTHLQKKDFQYIDNGAGMVGQSVGCERNLSPVGRIIPVADKD